MATIVNNHAGAKPELRPTSANYMSIYDFSSKYLPAMLEQAVDLYGKGILGFCRMFGSEKPVNADKTYWAEMDRLRSVEKNVALDTATNVFTTTQKHAVRKNTKIIVVDEANGKKEYGIVTAVNSDTSFIALRSDGAAWTVAATALTIISAGSEFKKGSGPMEGTIIRKENIYNTTVRISKSTHAINDSDLSNVAWLYAPDGTPYWHHQEVEDAIKRFDEEEELNFVTSVPVDPTSALSNEYGSFSGILDSIRRRGLVYAGSPSTMADIDDIIMALDAEQGEKSNALFLKTEVSLAIDDLLAAENAEKNGAGWGCFANKDTAIKFGFDSFMRGGYNFYKCTWNLLNDPTGAGQLADVHGILMPIGQVRVKTGYNDSLSGDSEITKINYLNLLYKAGNGDNRKKQITVYGRKVQNGRDDVTGIDITSETGLILCGANRWMLMQG
jgi:hypothetical protein